MRLFDTHSHLSDARFDADRKELIEALPAQGVELLMDIACDMDRLDIVLALIENYPFIYASVGIHPHDAAKASKGYLDRIERLLRHERMLVLGEIGLDYHYDFSPRDIQREVFAEQLELALQLDLPAVLHVREAFGDAMDILRARRGKIKGVMHCYSGSYELARECADMGLYIAFGGALTFHNAVNQREIASRLPLERIVIETDCPYMTPVPHRGKRNMPAYVGLVAEALARARNMDVDEVALITLENGKKLFGMG